MKKIFTLAVAVTIFTTSFAQYKGGGQKDDNYNKGKDVTWNDNGYKKDNDRFNDSYSFSMRERDMQVAQINREYDRKIREVQSRWFLSRYKKEDMIRSLNYQRQEEIRRVYAKFSDRRNRYDDHDYRRH